MVFELIYCSVARPQLCSSSINDIVRVARSFNAANKVTGCLLFHKDEFIQILEGDELVVRRLYEKICRDNRHSALRLLIENTKTDKSFETWAMAFHELDGKDLISIRKTLFIENFIAFSQFADKPTEAVKLFWYMAKQLLEEK